MSSGLVSIDSASLIALSRHSTKLATALSRTRSQRIGAYHSIFKGRGMEYLESRVYQPGDDIRNLDWKITARSGKAHTKLFNEERERPVFLWVDYRRPMFFATRGKYKAVIAAEIATLIAWSTVQNGDRIGGMIFSEKHHLELRPRGGHSAVLHFINKLVTHPSWNDASDPHVDATQTATHALNRLSHIARPGSLIFLISDFRNLNDVAHTQIISLRRHHDLAIIFIYDPIEQSLPPAGYYRLQDGDNTVAINTQSKHDRQTYHERFEARQSEWKKLASQYIACTTQNVPYQVLKQQQFKRRCRRF